jgi:hypothetical protein
MENFTKCYNPNILYILQNFIHRHKERTAVLQRSFLEIFINVIQTVFSVVSNGIIFHFRFTRIKKPLFNVCLSNRNDTPLSVGTTEPRGKYGMSLSCCVHCSCLGSFLLSILSHKPSVYRATAPSTSSRNVNSFLPCTFSTTPPFPRVFNEFYPFV